MRPRDLLAATVLLAAACAPVEPPEPPEPGLPTAEPNLRVSLADTASVVLEHRGGARFVDLASGREVHRTGISDRWGATRSGERIVLRSERGDRVEGMDSLRVEADDGMVYLDDRPYRGAFVLRREGDELRVVNHVPLEDYLLGVVPREIGRVDEELLEAAKAQAVAARTYAVSRLGAREAQGFDVYATVEDQVYGGVRDEHEPVSRAVRETEGEILIHDGEPIEAYYHSTCAGRTAAIEEVWNAEPRPYLQSVRDVNPETGQAYDHFSSRFRWTERWTAEEIESILGETLRDSLDLGAEGIGALLDMEVLERTPSGRVADMRIETRAGTVHVGRDRVRWILRPEPDRILNSALFDVTLVRQDDGTVREVIADGQGWGHGIGMCQVGAMGRARHGQLYDEILATYYPNTRLVRLYD